MLSILAFLSGICCLAQSRVSADVEVKTLMDGKVTTVTKRTFCNGNGRVVTVFSSPTKFVTCANLSGEVKMYSPADNTVFSDRKDDFSTKDELLYLFLSGRSADMGLTSFGYKLVSSEPEEGGYLKRTYKSSKSGAVPKIEIVLKDYLPVYIAYYNGAGKIVSKTYLSSYDMSSRLVLPARVTSIDYLKNRDSTVVRTLYSNIRIDSDEPEFSFEVPSDAVAIKNPLKK